MFIRNLQKYIQLRVAYFSFSIHASVPLVEQITSSYTIHHPSKAFSEKIK